MRLLDRYPEIASDLLHASRLRRLAGVWNALAGDAGLARKREARRGHAIERSRATAATSCQATSGPNAGSRCSLSLHAACRCSANDNAAAIARALLDRGADPNVYFMAGAAATRRSSARSVKAKKIGRRTRARRAGQACCWSAAPNPYDIQVIYNIHFTGKILWS